MLQKTIKVVRIAGTATAYETMACQIRNRSVNISTRTSGFRNVISFQNLFNFYSAANENVSELFVRVPNETHFFFETNILESTVSVLLSGK